MTNTSKLALSPLPLGDITIKTNETNPLTESAHPAVNTVVNRFFGRREMVDPRVEAGGGGQAGWGL